jgi:hypothetical protein
MSLHPVVADVTAEIVARSKDSRSAYLETEHLGQGERRLPKGVITKQDI